MTDPTQRLTPVVRLAPAKLNLTLAVVGRRDDGYHSLHSVMVPLALADRLSLAILPAGDDTLHVTGFDPGPADRNLALRAIALARSTLASARIPTPPLAVRLDKRIPVAAGLAGGSSDAVAALDGALEAWSAELDAEQRFAIAARLGSDVPFFLSGGPALVEGRGERVTPRVPARTADVFAAWSNGAMAEPGVARRTSEHFASEFGAGLTVRALVERAGVLASANDLWPAATVVVPGILPLRRALTRLLRRPIGLSGSGPTLWALYPSAVEAATAADAVLAAIDDASIRPSGGEPPFVAATTIQTEGRDE